jgi:hypothetical protein
LLIWNNGTCVPATPTATPTPTPTSTPTPTVTPTPTPVDVCPNIQGVQTNVPEGYHLNSDHQCVPNIVECDDDCVTPTPTPTEEVTPTPTVTPTPESNNNGGSSGGGSASAPTCSDGSTTQLPANPHVVRKGTEAWVNSFITQGDSENIYWGETSDPNWMNENSSAGEFPDGVKPNADKFVSYHIGNLKEGVAYNFGIQQKQGCGTGQLVTAVIIDGPQRKEVNENEKITIIISNSFFTYDNTSTS